MKLSNRLTSVAQYIPKDSILADIGSDHAYLPIYCIQNQHIKKAIAGEVVKGPFEAAKKSVKEAGLEDFIEVRKGDGLEVIEIEDQVECITIAGMGGGLITSILEKGKDKLFTVKRLVLQPNLAAQSIRKWLIDNQWTLVDEEILEEDGHIYEILVADKNSKQNPYKELEKELLFGPFLLKEKGPIFQMKWAREYKEWKRIYQQLEKADSNEAVEQKKKDLLQYISWYEEELGNENR